MIQEDASLSLLDAGTSSHEEPSGNIGYENNMVVRKTGYRMNIAEELDSDLGDQNGSCREGEISRQYKRKAK